MSVVTGAAQYPEELLNKIQALGVKVLSMDALALAEQAGSAKAVNVALIGAMAKTLGYMSVRSGLKRSVLPFRRSSWP